MGTAHDGRGADASVHQPTALPQSRGAAHLLAAHEARDAPGAPVRGRTPGLPEVRGPGSGAVRGGLRDRYRLRQSMPSSVRAAVQERSF